MSYLINNQQKLNDIIFAKRNKSYGAYAIRSSYGFTIMKSLGLMILGFSSAIITAWYFTNRNHLIEINRGGQIVEHDTTTVFIMPPPEQEQPKQKTITPPPPSNPLSSEVVSTNIRDSVLTEGPQPDSLIVPSFLTGNSSLVAVPHVEGDGTVTTTNTISLPPDGEILNGATVDKEAEFEGGITALLRFIKSNLTYPREAFELGKSGVVYIRFVVNEDGKVGQITVVKPQGYGMDEEAVRVISMVPKFKSPAFKNGRAVKMYYHLPLRFQLNR